jgi:hypothetical protein
MTTYKDILYKKNDDETWTEWNNRVPHDEQDKLDYIEETIYSKICENDKEKAGEISGLLIGMGVEDLIPLLESEELLDAKIEEAYKAVRDFEEYKMSEEEEMFEEDILSRKASRRRRRDERRLEKEEKVENKKEKEEEQQRYEEEDHDVYKQPLITLTVAEMIEALSKLPPDAKLVITESGFYSNSEFADIMLPRPYKVENERFDCGLPTGTQVYIIGHSHQSY